ncbi:MAG TPA: DinB family protein [Streptosporangiaceae bacterium]
MTDDQSPAGHAAAIDGARQRLLRFVEGCGDGDWGQAPVDGDPRPVAVIADHVADAYEYLAGWIADLVAGREATVSMEIVDDLNAAHAADASGLTQAEVAAHLRSSGDALIALVAGLQPEQLGLADGRPARLAVIAARHADDHREQIESGLAAAG